MIYAITPVPKPRQTQRDKWDKRPSVLRYRAFADEVRLRGVKVPEYGCRVVFHMPMPKSWSKKKKELHCNLPHQQVPDIDNLGKSLLDAVFADDCRVFDIRFSKYWAEKGMIEII